MGDRYVKPDENKKIIYIDANNLYSHSMSQPQPFDETKFAKNVKLAEISNSPSDNDFGNFIEVDLKCPDIIKEKTKNFPFAPEIKKISRDYFSDYMKTNKQDTCTQTKRLICDWSEKKSYLIHYRLLKIHVRHGTIIDEVRNILSFRQSKWLENDISFKTKKT